MFRKFQGLGNDFVLVDGRALSQASSADLSRAREICDRRRGIGGDGLIVLLDGSNGCQYTMRIINADGTEAEMCGNGIRCLAVFIKNLEAENAEADSDSSNDKETVSYSISTLAGKITADVLPGESGGNVVVDMGEPVLFPWSIACNLQSSCDGPSPFPLSLHHDTYFITDISMGNPHAVVFINDLDSFLPKVFRDEGPALSSHFNIFPTGTNAEFAQVLSPTHVRLEVWERGSGHTQACGTGACATVVAGVQQGLLERNEWCRVTLPGGDLLIKWIMSDEGTGRVLMQGPAEEVFRGESSSLLSIFSEI